MDYRPNISTSSACIEYFKDTMSEFGTIKEISCVFDSVNFLFFEAVQASHNHFIAKSYEGNHIFLSDIRCGYNGEGPHAFSRILIFLGVPKSIAEEVMLHAAVKVFFDIDGTYQRHEYPDYFIDSRHRKGYIDSKYVRTTLASRKIYFANPERYMQSLFPLIDNLKPYKITYWIGENSELEGSDQTFFSFQERSYEDFEERKRKYRRRHSIANEVNIVLLGRDYEIALLIPKAIQISFLESILLYLKADSFIEEHKRELTEFYYPSFFEKWFRRGRNSGRFLNGNIHLGEYDE